MNAKKIVLSGMVACAIVSLFTIPSMAHKAFLDKARKMYELDAKNGKCDLCHEVKPKEEPGAKNLNAYGKDIAAETDMKPLLGKKEDYKFSDAEIKTLETVMKKIEDKDSDGDDATNKEELALGSNPGDKKSVPAKRDLQKYRKTAKK